MKKFSAVFLTLVLILSAMFVAVPSVSADTPAVLHAQNAYVKAGEKVKIPLFLLNASSLKNVGDGSIGGFQLDLVYESEQMTLTGFEIGELFKDYETSFSVLDNGRGRIMSFFFDFDAGHGTRITDGMRNDLLLGYMEFTTKSGFSGTDVYYDNVIVCDSRQRDYTLYRYENRIERKPFKVYADADTTVTLHSENVKTAKNTEVNVPIYLNDLISIKNVGDETVMGIEVDFFYDRTQLAINGFTPFGSVFKNGDWIVNLSYPTNDNGNKIENGLCHLSISAVDNTKSLLITDEMSGDLLLGHLVVKTGADFEESSVDISLTDIYDSGKKENAGIIGYLEYCKDEGFELSNVEVSRLVITSMPTKTTYYEGEKQIDTDGMVVTATYSDGKQEPVTDYTIGNIDFTPGSKTVTVSYGGQITSFRINVLARTLEKIELTAVPNRSIYAVGEGYFDLTGMVVLASFDQGSDVVLNETDYTVTGFDTSTVGEKTITVTYRDKSATFTIEVKEAVVTKLYISAMPNKTEYNTGDKILDTRGLRITADLSNGQSETISPSKCTITGFDTDNPGEKVITVTYDEKTAIFVINVTGDPLTPPVDKAVVAVEEALAAFPTEITDDNIEDAKAVIAAYDALTDEQKDKLSDQAKNAIVSAKQAVKDFENSTVVVPTIVKGDLTDDGKVTVSDILALKTIIMSGKTPTEAQLKVADLAPAIPDGKLTVSDILGIKAIIMG